MLVGLAALPFFAGFLFSLSDEVTGASGTEDSEAGCSDFSFASEPEWDAPPFVGVEIVFLLARSPLFKDTYIVNEHS